MLKKTHLLSEIHMTYKDPTNHCLKLEVITDKEDHQYLLIE